MKEIIKIIGYIAAIVLVVYLGFVFLKDPVIEMIQPTINDIEETTTVSETMPIVNTTELTTISTNENNSVESSNKIGTDIKIVESKPISSTDINDSVIDNTVLPPSTQVPVENPFTSTTSTAEPIKVKTVNKEIKDMLSKVRIDISYEIDNYNKSEWKTSTQFRNPFTLEKESMRLYAIAMSNRTASQIFNGLKYRDPFSEEIITDQELLEYTYIIPSKYVATHGGSNWDTYRKQQYLDDVANVLIITDAENKDRGEKSLSEYMPENNQEEYCYTWLSIALKYNIALEKEDYNIIKDKLYYIEEIPEFINDINYYYY